MRAPPAAARAFTESARTRRASPAPSRLPQRGRRRRRAGGCTEVSPGGFRDSALLPPIANTCSCDARPPPDEVGVPPTVIATNSLPPDGEDRRPGSDLAPGLERPQHLARLRVERAEHAVAAACEADAGRRQADAAPLGLRRVELPDALAGRDVDRADRAVILPARQVVAEVAVVEPEEDVAEQELALLLRRRQLLLDEDAGRLGGGVVDVVELGS